MECLRTCRDDGGTGHIEAHTDDVPTREEGGNPFARTEDSLGLRNPRYEASSSWRGTWGCHRDDTFDLHRFVDPEGCATVRCAAGVSRPWTLEDYQQVHTLFRMEVRALQSCSVVGRRSARGCVGNLAGLNPRRTWGVTHQMHGKSDQVEENVLQWPLDGGAVVEVEAERALGDRRGARWRLGLSEGARIRGGGVGSGCVACVEGRNSILLAYPRG